MDAHRGEREVSVFARWPFIACALLLAAVLVGGVGLVATRTGGTGQAEAPAVVASLPPAPGGVSESVCGMGPGGG